ncbi:MAG: diguanylate cyclase [Gammaproteobacteria bacterium]|nr:diguanylate cyclase [Gammaproteobacteria bacterium]
MRESAEALRLALPLMTRNSIPPTPENYAIWFHYVIGDRAKLNEQIDQMLERNQQFTTEVNEQLYRRFISRCDMEQAEKVRDSVASALIEASAALKQTGSEADQFRRFLGSFDQSFDSADSMNDIYGLLNTVLEETQNMQTSMERLQQEFEEKSHDMEQLREELNQVRKQASTDALTGLLNRAAFFDLLERTDEGSDPLTKPYCLVMIDIDHFKRVNDTFGHLVGDKVIRFVAESLRQSIKGKDAAARYGGEEYSVLLPDTALNNAITLFNRIREQIANTNLVRTGSRETLGQVTISAGVAQKRANESRMDLLARADRALYLSKKNGRNRVTGG